MHVSKDNINYSILTKDLIDETVELITDIFLNREPTTSVLKIEPKLYKTCMKFFLNMSAENGFCIIAKDINSGAVIGFQTARDFAPEGNLEMFPDLIKFFEAHEPSMTLEDKLKEEYVKKHNFKPGECIHLMQLGVKEGYERKGIGTNLVTYALENFISKGYKTFMTDCSSSTSKHCLERCGFHEENYLDFKSYKYKGKYWFKDLEGGHSFLVKEY
ncbi:MAG: GNAT family N-acetyltransferase [FCB group bacterium]|jgi:ribosomal protein S18 acetylase RimI-like enzyme